MYKNLAPLYSLFFPLPPGRVEWLRNLCPTSQSWLDVGCSTAQLVEKLNNLEITSIGCDLDSNSLILAKHRVPTAHLVCSHLSALGFSPKFKFDTISCLGNTLAHLESIEAIDLAFSQIASLLSTGGIFILQIVNFNHPEINLKKFPLLEKVPFSFERKYEWKEEKLYFLTRLVQTTSGERTILQESVKILYPLKVQELETLFAKNQFRLVNRYSRFGSYQENPQEWHLYGDASVFIGIKI